MEITVAEILASDLLKDARLIAGKKGLYRSVSSVTVGEVPDIADWLKGGEVVLSTLYAVSEDSSAQLEFVRKIIDKQAAALLIKPGRFIKKPEKALIKEAEETDFPLIEVPNDVRWTDIIRDIYDRMIKTEVEIRMKGDLIDDLLAGQFKPEELVRRAGFLGADLSRGSLGLVTDIDAFGDMITTQNMDEEAVQRLKRELLSTAAWFVRRFSEKSLVSLKSDEVIALITPPAKEPEAATMLASAVKLANDIRNTFSSRYNGFDVSIGLGRFYAEPENLSRTFDEARTALKIGRVLGRQDAVTCFDDVGAYKLLLRVYEQSPEDLRALYEETVKPLTDYDEKHRSELAKTLERYLANDMSLNKTAGELIAHRHTIKYRLNRVAEITGLSVDSSENVERLGLGLKAARLLDGLNRP